MHKISCERRFNIAMSTDSRRGGVAQRKRRRGRFAKDGSEKMMQVALLAILCMHVAIEGACALSFRPPPIQTRSTAAANQPARTMRISCANVSAGSKTFHSIFTQPRRIAHSLFASASNDEESDAPSPVSAAVANGEDELTKLRRENELLQERLTLLQTQNDQLLRQQKESPEADRVSYEQRLILEDFEGEGIPFEVEFKNAMSRIRTAGDGTEDDDELGLSDPIEDDVCEYDDASNSWGECPVEPNVTFADAMKSRAYWLVGLLALQSCSGFILSRNELLLQDHPVIIYFLTMLVGAGGNAGNQASVRVIRGLALGTLNPQTQGQFLSREFRMAFALSLILSLAGFLRATVFHTPFPETMAVTLALSMIVFSSICLGAVLPLLLQKVGVDPAHSSTTIQVVMDILGVVLTVFVSTMVLDSALGKILIQALTRIGL
ncbi:hypothetical protein ACHAXT_001968 [Thalassiosira profunda]